jgi:hypothetical protein
MHRLTAAAATAVALLLLTGPAAFAQVSRPEVAPYPTTSTKARKGSSEQHKACARDANRFCADEIPEGDMQVLGCLKTHRARLSKACSRVLAEHGQ